MARIAKMASSFRWWRRKTANGMGSLEARSRSTKGLLPVQEDGKVQKDGDEVSPIHRTEQRIRMLDKDIRNRPRWRFGSACRAMIPPPERKQQQRSYQRDYQCHPDARRAIAARLQVQDTQFSRLDRLRTQSEWKKQSSTRFSSCAILFG